MKVELTRTQLCSLIMACTAADAQSSEDTMKWKKLHDQLKNVLCTYDMECESIYPAVPKRVYKCEEGDI